MDFTANKNDLARLFTRAASAAATKSPTTTLKCVWLQAEREYVIARATDLYVGLESSVPAQGKASGTVCIDARRAAEIAKALPPGEVRVRVKDSKVLFTAGKAKFQAEFLPGEDFPELPRLDDAKVATVAAQDLATLLAQGAYAMAADDSRHEQHACLLEMEGALLRAVSTDGHRMTIAECAIDGELPQVLIPSRGVGEIKKLCEAAKDGAIGIASVRGMAFFQVSDGVLSVKQLDNVFPPYRRLKFTPKHTITVHRENLADAVRRASVATVTTSAPTIVFEFSEGCLRVSSENGDAEDEVTCDSTVAMKVSSAPKYLLDALGSVRDDEVHMGITGPLDPIVVRPASSNECTGIVMPRSKDGT